MQNWNRCAIGDLGLRFPSFIEIERREPTLERTVMHGRDRDKGEERGSCKKTSK